MYLLYVCVSQALLLCNCGGVFKFVVCIAACINFDISWLMIGPDRNSAQYRVLQTLYRVGVFLSRSSAQWLPIKRVGLLAGLEVCKLLHCILLQATHPNHHLSDFIVLLDYPGAEAT